MSAWSELLSESLGVPAGAASAVERLSVRPGEVAGRVRAGGGRGSVHEVSLIRPVPPEPERERVCAALASQPVFRARILAEELPVAADRVFALLGWDLVPRSWDALVATCSCEAWESRCAHLDAVAAALGAEADRDPFALTRWLGLDRRALVARVRTLPRRRAGASGAGGGRVRRRRGSAEGRPRRGRAALAPRPAGRRGDLGRRVLVRARDPGPADPAGPGCPGRPGAVPGHRRGGPVRSFLFLRKTPVCSDERGYDSPEDRCTASPPQGGPSRRGVRGRAQTGDRRARARAERGR
ncbi:hypothetical protein HFP72_00430 [Nocardiopsis sp. ARC36]